MLEILKQSFFINSLVSLIIIGLVSGTLGSFMIWQKMSYLGDSLSHSSLLGVALALIFKINLSIIIVLIAILFAVLLSLNFDKLYSADTVLNIVTNVILSLSLILISSFTSSSNSIMSSLFGDILTLDQKDLITIFFISLLVTFILIFRWRYWLMISINQELAEVEKINTKLVRLEFLITLAIFIAISAQLIGILLISAFLLIPSASARLLAKTPTEMIVLATFFSIVSGISGLLISAITDFLPGPTIILTSTLYLVLSYLIRSLLSVRI
ncbi:metal ABC transporter permease [Wolbachia endosymbiont of Pentidionis agamae]|uniref:metal ABC transporter permease n=1 Tax=Wolbachia endosymbiont of Pentidionis agamae TaxID=3110435 RepID=UPI002FD01F7B